MADSRNISLNVTLLDEAQLFAKQEGLPLEQVVNEALEQGLAGLRSIHFFRSRRGKGNVEQALETLRNAGKGNPPMSGDELPEDLKHLLDA